MKKKFKMFLEDYCDLYAISLRFLRKHWIGAIIYTVVLLTAVHDLDLLFGVRRSRHNRRLVQEYFWSNKTIFQA